MTVAGEPARYTVRQISFMIGLTPRQIRAYAHLGILEPITGPHGRFEFSFQDLVVLRTAKGLLDQDVSSANVHATLRALKDELDQETPLTTVSIVALGGTLAVVREGDLFDPISGQEIFGFEVATLSDEADGVCIETDIEPDQEGDAEAWYLYGDEIEGARSNEAVVAYRRAIALDPGHIEARISLGRLLHDSGDVDGALEQFTAVTNLKPSDAIGWYNLGVALEDAGEADGAIDAYLRSLDRDNTLADAHHHVAKLFESAGEQRQAIQHLAEYRRLVK